MHRRQTFKVLFLSLSLLAAFAGCAQPYFTQLWWDNGSSFNVSTNDVQRCGTWLTYTAAYESTMTTVEVYADKARGNPVAPFGFLFASPDPSNYYALYIDIQGYYFIGKVLAGSGSIIQNWTFSPALNTGFSVGNTFSVTNDGGGTFSIRANGSLVTTFSDSSFDGGYEVLVVGILSEEEEDFPDVPEELNIRMTSPEMVPAP